MQSAAGNNGIMAHMTRYKEKNKKGTGRGGGRVRGDWGEEGGVVGGFEGNEQECL